MPDQPTQPTCACGCGAPVRPGRKWVPGHNMLANPPKDRPWQGRLVGKPYWDRIKADNQGVRNSRPVETDHAD